MKKNEKNFAFPSTNHRESLVACICGCLYRQIYERACRLSFSFCATVFHGISTLQKDALSAHVPRKLLRGITSARLQSLPRAFAYRSPCMGKAFAMSGFETLQPSCGPISRPFSIWCWACSGWVCEEGSRCRRPDFFGNVKKISTKNTKEKSFIFSYSCWRRSKNKGWDLWLLS